MKRVQNKHRRSAKKHLIKNKSKSRSRKYKIGAGGGEDAPPSYAHGLSEFPVRYGISAAPSTQKPKPAPPQKPK